MTENFLKHRLVNMGERLVRVLEKNEISASFSPSTFSISAVERVREIDEKRSFLILTSGFKIPVALSFAELEKKIYRPDFKTDDTEILDLTKVTGKEAQLFEAETLKPGDVAADGTIYLGLHKDKDWFVTDKDTNLRMSFNAAAEYAQKLKAHGHDDWIVPPGENDPNEADILKAMFKSKNLGAFKNTYADGWYWSSTTSSDKALQYNFNEGRYLNYSKTDAVNVRCVRAVPRF
jgi:hypothetical protein